MLIGFGLAIDYFATAHRNPLTRARVRLLECTVQLRKSAGRLKVIDLTYK